MNPEPTFDPTALCPTCDVQVSVGADGLGVQEHEPGCRTAVFAWSDPLEVARLRAFQLCVCRLTGDRLGAERLNRELGDNREAWLRLHTALVGLGWAEVCAFHGVDLKEADADWPASAHQQLERELATEPHPTRQLALRATLALTETATHAEGHRLLVEAERTGLAVALTDLVLSRQADPGAFLQDCQAAVTLLETTLGVRP